MVQLPDWRDLPQSTARDERETAEEVFDRLAPFFHIDTEVCGTHCSGRRLRIDAVITPKAKFKSGDVHFGLEIKKAGVETLGDKCKVIGQSVDYANTRFDKYGYLYILHFPSVVNMFSDAREIAHILGRLGVGELTFRHPMQDGSGGHEAAIYIHRHAIWQETLGPLVNWSLERKAGAR